jgi:hypothetical protein
MRASASFLEISHRAIKMILPDVGDDYLHAGVMKHLGHTETNAAPAAGDEGYFPFYIFHNQSSADFGAFPFSICNCCGPYAAVAAGRPEQLLPFYVY